jgi:hypothetical protein
MLAAESFMQFTVSAAERFKLVVEESSWLAEKTREALELFRRSAEDRSQIDHSLRILRESRDLIANVCDPALASNPFLPPVR